MNRRNFLMSLSSAAVAGSSLSFSNSTGAAAAGVGSAHITVGSSLSLTGLLAGRSAEAVVGINAAFSAINKAGGVNGREFRFLALDDGYVPAKAVDNVNRLIGTEGIFALMSCTGTAHNAAIIPLIERAGVPYVGPIPGTDSLRAATGNHVFHLKVSHGEEVNRMTQQVVTMGMRNVAVIYLDNEFGVEISKRMSARLAEIQHTPVVVQPVSVNGSNLASAVDKVFAARPDVVALATTGTVSAGVIRELRARSSLLPIVGISASLAPSDYEKLGPAVQGLALTQVFPDASSPAHSAARAYQSAMRASGHDKFNANSFEGYVSAMVLAEGVRRLGRDATREGLRSAMAAMTRYDLGDFALSFNGDTPFVGSRYVSMGILGANGRFIG
jgi:branched-chain amino acid transport system substrate-binding protein